MVPRSLETHPFFCRIGQLGPRIFAITQAPVSSSVLIAGEERGRILYAYTVVEAAASAGSVRWALHNGLDANAPIIAQGWLGPQSSETQQTYGLESFNGFFLEVISGTLSITLVQGVDSKREHMIDFTDESDRADIRAGRGMG